MENHEGCERCGAVVFLYSGLCPQCYCNPLPLVEIKADRKTIKVVIPYLEIFIANYPKGLIFDRLEAAGIPVKYLALNSINGYDVIVASGTLKSYRQDLTDSIVYEWTGINKVEEPCA